MRRGPPGQGGVPLKARLQCAFARTCPVSDRERGKRAPAFLSRSREVFCGRGFSPDAFRSDRTVTGTANRYRSPVMPLPAPLSFCDADR
ncbi:hypothetical protein [Lysobacter gummosus]|uniref:hypothetical protein n=1 Tax=Lysobacter gummosus TaxID=262324 RepID=UPI00363AC957